MSKLANEEWSRWEPEGKLLTKQQMWVELTKCHEETKKEMRVQQIIVEGMARQTQISINKLTEVQTTLQIWPPQVELGRTKVEDQCEDKKTWHLKVYDTPKLCPPLPHCVRMECKSVGDHDQDSSSTRSQSTT